MKHINVHVGIIAYENTADLRKCLASVYKQTHRNISITVFDNSLSDKVKIFIKSHFPRLRYFKSAYNCGYGRGHNVIIRGLQYKTGDYYLSLNHDAILDSTYIEEMVGCLQKENAAWGTGKILNTQLERGKKKTIYSVGHAITRNGYFFNIGYGLVDEGIFDKQQEVFGAPGVAAMYAFRLIDRISVRGDFFDSTFFMYAEDTDVDWRARNAGLSCIYCPDAVSYHKGGTRPSWIIPYAISHRYLSAIKNASLDQLMFSIIPIMILHFIFRLLLTPKQGLRTLFLFVKKALHALLQRKTNNIVSQNKWFAWAKNQTTTQPTNLLSRLSTFFRNFFS